MRAEFKVVIVGFGKRGTNHLKHFRDHGAFEIAGVCDRNPGRLDNPLLAGVKTHTRARALMREVKCDVFCICTPPQSRYELVRLGVEAGARLVAIEKPIALSTREAFKTRDLIRAGRVKAVVCHQHRYGAHYRKVKEIIASGGIGGLHTLYATSTGWAMHLMSHLIDYMCWYNSDAKADWVMAQAAGRGKLRDNHPSPDYIAGVIQFANGVRGIIECGAGAPDVPEVEKWWHKNRILAVGSEGTAEVLTGGGWRHVSADGCCSGAGRMDYDLDMPGYVRDIARWLLDEKKPHPCDFDKALHGFEIMMGLWRSAVSGGQVALPLGAGRDEIAMMQKGLPRRKVALSSAVNSESYEAISSPNRSVPRASAPR
jgi:predicted dehydrogenase